MNIPMITTINNLYPNLAETLLEGTCKMIRVKGQTKNPAYLDNVKKNRFLDAVSKDSDLINKSGPELGEMFDVSRTTINIWKKECLS